MEATQKSKCPAEVEAYFQSGRKRALSVRAQEPYVLIVDFDDGVRKRYDWSHCLRGVLACLADYALFQKVYIDEDGCIAWDTPSIGHVDASADTVYIYGDSVEKEA